MRGRNPSAVQIRDRGRLRQSRRRRRMVKPGSVQSVKSRGMGRSPIFEELFLSPYKARLCSILSGQRMVNWQSASRQPCTKFHFLDTF